MPMQLKVGELSRRTGVSIRALHHYDQIGLLTPSAHTESGHRLYLLEDIARLQQIKSLQQLGLSLEEIQQCLSDESFSPLELLQRHLKLVREQMERQQQLARRLEHLSELLRSSTSISVDEFLSTIQEMTMTEKYFSPEQLEELKQRKEDVGEERIQEVQQEWPRLIAEVRAEMDKGTDPSDPKVQELAARWNALVQEFTGGNPEMAQSVRNMYDNEPEFAAQQGLDGEIFAYIQQAMKSE